MKDKLKKTLDNFRERLSAVRTGKANPNMLSAVRVEAYGTTSPLTQLAVVQVSKGALQVLPFDASNASAIEKAIRSSGLGLNPQSVKGYAQGCIMVPIPQISGDQREQLIVGCKKMAEEAKVAVRNIRRDEIKHIDGLGTLSKDSKQFYREAIDKQAADAVSEIDSSLAGKIGALREGM